MNDEGVLANQPIAPFTVPLYEYRQAMADYRLNPSTSALLIVDLQYGSADSNYGYGALRRATGHADLVAAYTERIYGTVVPNVQKLLQAFRAAGAPVIFLTVGSIAGDGSDLSPRFKRTARFWNERGLKPPVATPGSKEMEVLSEITPLPSEMVIQKRGASGFTNTTLLDLLRSLGVQELAICGVATNYCVESTLRDAADHGFDCVLVEDASAAYTEATHQRALLSMEPFCRVVQAETAALEIQASSVAEDKGSFRKPSGVPGS